MPENTQEGVALRDKKDPDVSEHQIINSAKTRKIGRKRMDRREFLKGVLKFGAGGIAATMGGKMVGDLIASSKNEEGVGIVEMGNVKIDEIKPESILSLTDRLMETVPINLKGDANVAIPLIIQAFRDEKIDSKKVLAFALATAEYESNFDLRKEEYEGANQAIKHGYEGGIPGGGLIQLTHASNYEEINKYLREKYEKFKYIDLVKNPAQARDPYASPYIFAAFFKLKGIVPLIENDDLEGARRKVVGDYSDDDSYNKNITKYIILRTKSYFELMKK